MGRTIAEAVGAAEKKNNYMEGNGYIVSWCFGHLYELADPESYWDPSYKKGSKVSWTDSMEHLPFFPDGWKFRYEIQADCEGQVKLLQSLMNRDDVDTIYAAGDADREGEVIVRRVIALNLKKKKRVLRLWLPSLTESVIRQAIGEARPDNEYTNLYRAGRTRGVIDWMIGIELTRFSSVKAGRFIRIGRCICPIVSKIVEREKEIRDFVPKTYYAVMGEAGNENGKITLTARRQFAKNHLADAVSYAHGLNLGRTIVEKVEKKQVEIKAGKLFSLSSLQSYVCKKDKSLSPADVLEAAQDLYEKGYITYPRTNSNYLCKDEEGRIDKIIRALSSAGYRSLTNKPESRHIYDDSKVESHSALTPTGKIPEGLSGAEKTVYDCIRNRFLAVFCDKPCLVNRTKFTIVCGDEEFHINGDVLVQKGWQEAEPVSKKDTILPDLKEGQELYPSYKPVTKKTTPPRRFTVESLNNWMITPFKDGYDEGHPDYTDEEWKDILSEATICTEATRADTIDRCIKSKYITLDKGVYAATSYGFYLVQVMGELHIDLSVKKTVDLSKNLHDITSGKESELDVLDETRQMLTQIIKPDAEIKTTYDYNADREIIGICPKCGKPVYETPKAFSCSNKDCGFALWKENKFLEKIGTKMTKARAKSLLKDGKFLAKGLSSKTGKKYDAYICMDGFDDRGFIRWKMAFPKKRKK